MWKFGKARLVAELARAMPGTTGQGGYFTLLATSLGRLGVKPLGGNMHRIRVEPVNSKAASKLMETLTPESGWKQPDGEENLFRFSCMTDDAERTARAILVAVDALRKGRRNAPVSDEAPEHFRKLIADSPSEDKRVSAFVAVSALSAPSPESEEDEAEGEEEIKDAGSGIGPALEEDRDEVEGDLATPPEEEDEDDTIS